MNKIVKFYNNNRNILFLISLFVVFILILLLNYNTIYAADDYNSLWNASENFNFQNVINRTLFIYINWTGRIVSSFLIYIFFGLSKNIFNIINSLVFLTYIYLIYRIIKKKNQTSPLLVLLIFFLVWFFIPQFGQVMLWQIGSVIYLWMITAVLAFLLPFVDILKKDKIKCGVILSIILFIFSIIVGNGLETNSIMLIALISLILLNNKLIVKKRLPIWMLSSYTGSIIGFLSNLFSPGNAIRMQSMGANDSLFNRIFYGLGCFFYRGIVETKIYIAITAIIFLYIIYLILNQKDKKAFFKKEIVIIFIALIVFILMLTGSSIIIGSFPLNTFLNWYYSHTNQFALFFSKIILLMIIIFILCFIFRKKIFKNTSNEINNFTLFFTVSAIIGMCAYMITPLAWPRSYMGMTTFLIVSICYLINNLYLNFKISKLKYALAIVFVIMFLIFTHSYVKAINDMITARRWRIETEKIINEQIMMGKTYIFVETYMSQNPYNAASVEKWLIPIVTEDYEYSTENGIHRDYEWINIAITNYYFGDNEAWNKGKRIIGYE